MSRVIPDSVYLWIAVASAFGGVARYWCQGFMARHAGDTFPWGTMAVNIRGCTFIGFFATLTGPEGRTLVPSTVRQFVMVGICGGCTTFSSFSWEALNLARDRDWSRAAGYIMGSLVVCLIGVWLGYVLATALNER